LEHPVCRAYRTGKQDFSLDHFSLATERTNSGINPCNPSQQILPSFFGVFFRFHFPHNLQFKRKERALELASESMSRKSPQITWHRQILFNCQRTNGETTAKRFSSPPKAKGRGFFCRVRLERLVELSRYRGRIFPFPFMANIET
jgi:hypothetical protein